MLKSESAQKAYESREKYHRQFTKRFDLKLNIHTDSDIIARLEEQPSMNDYMRNLIRADMERSSRNAD